MAVMFASSAGCRRHDD